MSKTDKTTTNTVATPNVSISINEIAALIIAIAGSKSVSKYVEAKKSCRKYEIAIYIVIIISLLTFLGGMIANDIFFPRIYI